MDARRRACRAPSRLGRLRKEKRDIESRLTELDAVPTRPIDPEAVVDTIIEGLADASRLFEHGTMEERKRVIRAFVEGITIDGSSQSGELRIKKLPEPDLASAGSSFVLVAGVRYEAQQRNPGREPEVVRVKFAARGRAWVPARAALAEDGVPAACA